ncbi:MAG TPA: YciI-like protein [Vicinamibacterales bacterium]|jgi:hypothetical protein
MKCFALMYDVVDGFSDKRTPYRDAHLKLVRDANGRGELVIAGAIGDPADGALLIFRSADASVAEAFARHDPYVINGLVRTWRVKPWNLVLGSDPTK